MKDKELWNLEDVRMEVEALKLIAGDDEAAHLREDLIRKKALEAIASGKCSDPSAIAAEALKTGEIEFERWCA